MSLDREVGNHGSQFCKCVISIHTPEKVAVKICYEGLHYVNPPMFFMLT